MGSIKDPNALLCYVVGRRKPGRDELTRGRSGSCYVAATCGPGGCKGKEEEEEEEREKREQEGEEAGEEVGKEEEEKEGE